MIRFAKAHACGNDFLVVEDSELAGRDPAETARRLCLRTTGVGGDGVEFLTITGERSGRIRLHNADGSLAEISGNGTRCVAAWFAHTRGLGRSETVVLTTDAGERHCSIHAVQGAQYLISNGMGVPSVHLGTVRLRDGLEVTGARVSTGNPHFVIFTEAADFTLAGRAWQAVGREICSHPDFPQQTNVEFVHVLAPDRIAIRIYERGVGPTSSSGTGTSATAAAAIRLRSAEKDLTVEAPGGAQQVEWSGGQSELILTGPAELIATGEAFLSEGSQS